MTDSDDLSLLTGAAALVSGSGRELIVATGNDRVRFLHGIVTGDVAGMPVGGGCRSALLTPKGHVVADMWMFARQGAVWMVVDGGQGEPTAAALSRYAIMDDFAAARQPEFALFALVGPEAPARLAAIGLTAALPLAERPPLSHADLDASGIFAAGTVWAIRVRELGADGFWIGGTEAAAKAVLLALEDAGTPRLTHDAAEAARIAALEPRWGAEITPDYFPMEVGLAGAIDYRKGCYLGQEPIVRIRDRGHLNWRLAGLQVTGPEQPAPQDTIESDVKPRAGRVTSAARLPDGRGVALAMLHVSVPVGAEVRIKQGDLVIPARVTAETATHP